MRIKIIYVLMLTSSMIISCSKKKERVAAEPVEKEINVESKRNLLIKNAEDLGLKDSLPKSFDEIQQQIENTPPLTEEEHKKADSIIQSRKVVLGKSQLGQKAEIDKTLDSLKNTKKSKEYQDFLDSISKTEKPIE